MSDITTSTAPGTRSLGQERAVSVKTVAEYPSKESEKPRPHICAACQRCFARLEHLSRHERTHTQDRPFECPECGRCFSRRDLLRRHQQKLHRTTNPTRPRNRRVSTTRVASTLCTPRNNSAATLAPGANSAAAEGRWPTGSITHGDGAPTEMFGSEHASAARGTAAQSCRTSLINIPIQSDQGGTQLGVPILDSPRTLPRFPAFDPEFNFEDIFPTPVWTVTSNFLHYDDFPQYDVMEQWLPLGIYMNDDICMDDAICMNDVARGNLSMPVSTMFTDLI